jgi:hypothetical protein
MAATEFLLLKTGQIAATRRNGQHISRGTSPAGLVPMEKQDSESTGK